MKCHVTRLIPPDQLGDMQRGRWPEDTIAAIDSWAAKQADKPGRSEAIRRLVEIGLKSNRK
jgi:hypothetical protein